MAKKIDNSTLTAIGRQKSADAYGMDANFDDGRTRKQYDAIQFINKRFPLLEIIDEHFNYPFLFYTVTFTTGHLIKFKIDAKGYYTFSTVAVFGGINTPFILTVAKEKQSKQTQISWQKRKNIRKVTLRAFQKIIITKCLQVSGKSVA